MKNQDLLDFWALLKSFEVKTEKAVNLYVHIYEDKLVLALIRNQVITNG